MSAQNEQPILTDAERAFIANEFRSPTYYESTISNETLAKQRAIDTGTGMTVAAGMIGGIGVASGNVAAGGALIGASIAGAFHVGNRMDGFAGLGLLMTNLFAIGVGVGVGALAGKRIIGP